MLFGLCLLFSSACQDFSFYWFSITEHLQWCPFSGTDCRSPLWPLVSWPPIWSTRLNGKEVRREREGWRNTNCCVKKKVKNKYLYLALSLEMKVNVRPLNVRCTKSDSLVALQYPLPGLTKEDRNLFWTWRGGGIGGQGEGKEVNYF